MPSKNFLFAHQKTTVKPHLELFMSKKSKIREKETYTIFRNLLNINKLRKHSTIPFFTNTLEGMRNTRIIGIFFFSKNL